MDSYTIIVVIFGILILGALIVLYYYNRLAILKNQVLKQYEGVLYYLEVEKCVVADMIHFIEENLEHEEDYIKKLQNFSERITSLKNIDGELQQFKKNLKVYLRFGELDQVYDFLTKNPAYLKIKESMMLNQERLVYALDSYDKGVKYYNDDQGNRLIQMIRKVFRFPRFDFYNE